MTQPGRGLYRPESLERLSSPERLDQLMRVAAPKDWFALAVLASLGLATLAWSIWGRVPVTLTGRGVLVFPQQTLPLQATAEGRLQALSVQVGQQVDRGATLALVDQTDLRQQLQQQQARLTQLQTQDRQLTSLSQDRLTLTLQSLRQQQATLQQRLWDLQQLSPALQRQNRRTLEQQRQALQQQLQDLETLAPFLRDRLASRRQLQQSGAISLDVVLEAERAYRENRSQMANLRTQMQELAARAITLDQTGQDTRNQIASLQTQIQELASQERMLMQQTLETTTTRRNQLQETTQTVARLSLALQQNGRVTSPVAGRVLELTVTPGQILRKGDRLGTLQADGNGALVGLLYFSIQDGKRLRPGMALQLTPDVVQRQRFGGIVGRVAQVSPLPVSRESMQRQIGNAQTVEGLVAPNGQIEVVAELQPDTTSPSGYRWSTSRGPDLPISAGTTATVRVTLGEEAPIALLLPFLRSLTGVY